ncbi:DUF2474 domain-containing protein [Pseudomonas fontis]|uniref:DUF2474 domain-containing protein n=1 Tax=Pseudomonas fontis TaxID=2942633 RepID=A0ABT5NTM3_9PSED|nr:DUF2474 domain-containing protein [Pseudomonas fontis]MDD0976080.1 DUF2474 domain-containing protein [Pseudomonas fontis]MDD0991530.1 DUF2474 domain-containing protein [Pseudomonas fontis]
MTGKDTFEEEKKPLLQRLGWLAVIWTGSVLTLAVFAWLVRLFMSAAGLSTPG